MKNVLPFTTMVKNCSLLAVLGLLQLPLAAQQAGKHISDFVSVTPAAQDQHVTLPSSHAFQVIFEEGQAYTHVNAGQSVAKGTFDFTAFVGDQAQTSSIRGKLSINHETTPGGVSMLDVHYDPFYKKWLVSKSQSVLFIAPSLGVKSSKENYNSTIRNCSGGITPWGTVITSEENLSTADTTEDGYVAIGWHVEIDPVTAKVKQYGKGKPEKLWALGRMSHENIALDKDSLTAYYGDDVSNGNIFKFVADKKTDLSKGTLYVLKLDASLVSNEPVSATGVWVKVPNNTVAERNNVKSSAVNLLATSFNGVEDVEIGPLDHKIYFTAKGNNRTFRFRDLGNAVAEFETFVGGKSYSIFDGKDTNLEPWGSGNDNLTFDDKGNLYVLQDGSRNHVWLVRPEHTQSDPRVELFMRTPLGSEPTGMTFSPNYQFIFISIQGPDESNTQPQPDAQDHQVVFNSSKALVVARKELLETGNVTSIENSESRTNGLVFPNPSEKNFTVSVPSESNSVAEVMFTDVSGRVIQSFNYPLQQGENRIPMTHQIPGNYLIKVNVNGRTQSEQLIIK